MGRNNKHKRGARNKRGPVRSERRPSMTGRVQLHEHSAYVITENGDYKVMGRGKREIMDGDTVAVSIKNGPHGERRAVIEGVIERAAISVVGTYQTAGPLGVIEPLDSRLKADFFILPEDTSAERLGVHPGDAVVARILTYPTRLESGTVTLERRIGGDDAPDLGVQYVMARYGYTDSYPEAALAEAEALSLDVTAALKDPLRRDLRDRFVITIDPVDARDFDDAISLERTPEGGYKLGVHIADVSHYVAWDGHIDLEARHRTTSVYLADRVLPMLPERLSNDLCSLRPDEDRLAFTVDIELDAQGRVRHYDPYPSVIRSRVRMDYDGAEALLVRAGAVEYSVLEGAAEDVAAAEASREEALERGLACEDAARGYNVDLADFLVAANELAELRRRIRRARGSVDFDTAEIRALLDEDGVPVQIVARERSCATSLSRRLCCWLTSALPSGWPTAISRRAIACTMTPAPTVCTVLPWRWRSSASSMIAVRRVLPWEVPMSCRRRLTPLLARLTRHSSTRSFCAACSVRCISLATRATLRSLRRATATLQAPFAVIPIWWCIAYSSCSWHTSSWVEKTPWCVRRG